MKQRTKDDLALLQSIRKQISGLQKDAADILEGCLHGDSIPSVKNVGFGFLKVKQICVVCERIVGEPSQEDIESCWLSFFNNKSIKITEEEVKQVIARNDY